MGYSVYVVAAAGVGLLTAVGGGSYRLHPALPAYLGAQWRAAADAAFEAERPAARRALLAAYAKFGTWLYQQIEGGSAETAFAMIALQRRTMGHLLGLALGEGRYGEAQDILEPLNEFWTARGLAQEARGWVDRCWATLEAADGSAPGFDTAAGALWLFMVGAEAARARAAGDLAAAEATCDAIRKSLEGAPKNESRDHRLAVAYHQLGNVAYQRGELGAAEAWYEKSLEIVEALGDRPKMAMTYGQLGLLSEERGKDHQALDWTVRCVALFPEFPHPATGPGPRHLARLTVKLGQAALAESWRRSTGAALPAAIRDTVAEMIEALGDAEK